MGGITMSGSLHIKLVLVILITISHGSSTCGDSPGKVDVKVMNSLEAGKDLTCHCKSKDRDFGVKNIPFDQIYDCSFHDPDGKMTISCNMQWESSTRRKTSGTFTIYGTTKYLGRCPGICAWMVQENGLCYYDRFTSKWIYVYGWNDDGKSNTTCKGNIPFPTSLN
ncbi:hypothetical protein NE237_020266 [Protea cynaroides]|uniref:S-protein homolog n=1 Tax=Protea cynaroides TaxID=273540 RepID=A0A9Q0H830_9MAGN|nr:hypothetical protein NE237_020266 [Protea cynaroides]